MAKRCIDNELRTVWAEKTTYILRLLHISQEKMANKAGYSRQSLIRNISDEVCPTSAFLAYMFALKELIVESSADPRIVQVATDEYNDIYNLYKSKGL